MASGSSRLGEELSKAISGSVEWDDDVLDGYSADASPYRIRPRMVAFPRDAKDVSELVRFAAKNKMGITPRGGGTGLVGGGIGGGIVVSLREIGGVSLQDCCVTAGAGAPKGLLDRVLGRNGKFLSPDPSVGPYCTVGGMIATNASGPLALKYGSVIDNILEVEFVDGCGRLRRFPGSSDLSRATAAIAGDTGAGGYPRVSKNSCGYRLDAVASAGDAHKILAGSEGTLGIITSAKLRVYDIPARRTLFVCGYGSACDAARDCIRIAGLRPAAAELVDRRLAGTHEAIPEQVRFLLYVCMDGSQEESSRIQGILRGRLIQRADGREEADRWWRYRHRSMQQAVKGMPAGLNIFEDAAVPAEHTCMLMRLIEKMGERFGVDAILYGHVGNGNPHVLVSLAGRGEGAVREFAEAYFAAVIGMGGTITGEHGDGQARADFVRMQYGNHTFSKFRELKRLFDPKGVLNPDKIISDRRLLTRNLRV